MSLWHDERGATALTYGLLGALVGISVLGALRGIGTQFNNIMGLITLFFWRANR